MICANKVSTTPLYSNPGSIIPLRQAIKNNISMLLYKPPDFSFLNLCIPIKTSNKIVRAISNQIIFL